MLSTLLIVTALFGGWGLSDAPPRVDGLRYFTVAYNVAVEGVYSNRMPQEGLPTPDNRWEPLYSWTLAPGVGLAAHVTGESLSCFLASEDACAAWHPWLKLPNLVYLVGLVAATAWIGRRLLRSESWALVAAGTVGLLYLFPAYVNVYFAEILAALLITLHAGTLLVLVQERGRSLSLAALSGAILGLATLTNAVFLYWVPLAAVTVGAGVAATQGGRRDYRRGLAVAGVLLTVSAAIPSVWIARNVMTVPEASAWQIRSGGGGILSKRVELASMTPAEYGAAWVYWSMPTYGPPIAERLLPESSYHRLVRSEPDSFYQIVRRGEGRAARGDTGAALRLYVEELPRQLALTPLVAYRGTVPWAQFRFANEPSWLSVARFAQELFYRFSLFAIVWVVWAGIRRRAFDEVVLWGPVSFSVAFHAVLTHYLPRYSVPIAALAALAVLSMLRVGCGRVPRRSGQLETVPDGADPPPSGSDRRG
jgi:hypothetical protein